MADRAAVRSRRCPGVGRDDRAAGRRAATAPVLVGAEPEPLPSLPSGAAIAPRVVGLRKGSDGWLATLTARLPYMANPPLPRPDGVRDYRALLAHALADGRIVGEEAAQLATLAARAGLTQRTARQVHDEFLADARARAEADGVVTTAELKELQRAAKELAASHLISDLEEAAAANRARNNGSLRGWRIMPVGDSAAVTEVVDYAVEHGAKVAVNLTKTVRLVVSDGAAQDDPRITKALAAGVDVLTPEQARKLLEGEAAKVRGGLFADSAGEQVADRLAAERAAAARPARPEWHEFWRPRELAPAEYRARFVDRRDDWDDGRPRNSDHRSRRPAHAAWSDAGCPKDAGCREEERVCGCRCPRRCNPRWCRRTCPAGGRMIAGQQLRRDVDDLQAFGQGEHGRIDVAEWSHETTVDHNIVRHRKARPMLEQSPTPALDPLGAVQ